MLLTLFLVGYAAGAGATYMRFLQIYDLLDRTRARLIWLVVATLGSLLWPVTWALFAALAWLAKHDDRH
jgi:hypothetical protein